MEAIRCRIRIVRHSLYINGVQCIGTVKIRGPVNWIDLDLPSILQEFNVPWWADDLEKSEVFGPLYYVGCHEIAHIFAGSDENMCNAVAALLSGLRLEDHDRRMLSKARALIKANPQMKPCLQKLRRAIDLVC